MLWFWPFLSCLVGASLKIGSNLSSDTSFVSVFTSFCSKNLKGRKLQQFVSSHIMSKGNWWYLSQEKLSGGRGKYHHIPRSHFDFGVSSTNELGMKAVEVRFLCVKLIPMNQFLWKLWSLDPKMKLSCFNGSFNFYLKVPISIPMKNKFTNPNLELDVQNHIS